MVRSDKIRVVSMRQQTEMGARRGACRRTYGGGLELAAVVDQWGGGRLSHPGLTTGRPAGTEFYYYCLYLEKDLRGEA
jgi:hypothetical protein